MLRLQTAPDDIFIAMLDCAITERLEVVLVFDDDSEEQQEAFECYLPRSSTVHMAGSEETIGKSSDFATRPTLGISFRKETFSPGACYSLLQ